MMNDACVLTDSGSSSRLVIEPAYGCVATSWVVRDQEVLALPSPHDAFVSAARTGGIPLLYPYANRLRTDRFQVAGKSVDLSTHANLKRDPTGLAIHGLLLRWANWNISRTGENQLQATIEWGDHPELMDAFPFEHRLVVQWKLSGDASQALLAITTRIEATGRDEVAIAFGWHPYFAVDSTRTPTLSLPARRAIALDRAGLPDRAAPVAAWVDPSTESIGANQDNLYALPASAAGAPSNRIDIACGSATTSLTFGEGYEFMQVYSPAGAPFVCVEPMTAATSALTDGCTTVRANSAFEATFTIRR